MLNLKSEKRVSIIIIICMIIGFLLGNPDISYGAQLSPHVIYEVIWLSDNSSKVTLKWSDTSTKTPIRITSWRMNDDQSVTIKYQQGQNVISGFNSRMISDVKLSCPCIFILEEDEGANSESNEIFPDLPKDIEGSMAIKHLYYLGIINGYTNGTFSPDGNVSRAEFSKMLYLSGEMTTNLDSPITFTDVTSNHWAKNYIYTLASFDIVKGKGNNLFDPNGTITIGEVMTIIDRSFVLYDDSKVYPYELASHWSNEYFVSMVGKGIVHTTDSFYYPYTPTKIATRKDCAILLSRVLSNFHEVNN